MITLIYGPKGSGKTKKIIDAANNSHSAGNCVFLGKKRYIWELSTRVRFVDSEEYGIAGKAKTLGFILGLIAGNCDIDEMYIDGLHRIVGEDVKDLQDVFESLDTVGMTYHVNFTIAVTTEPEVPEYLKKYI